MSSILPQIIRQAKTTWDPLNIAAIGQNVHQLRQLLDQLTASDLPLPPSILEHGYLADRRQPPRRVAPCTYISLLEHPNVTISVFILHAGSEMPLHDHPSMHGLLKPVSGQLAVQCYSALDPAIVPASVADDQKPIEIPVRREEPLQLAANSPSLLLSPSHSNFHQIQPIGATAAAFLDILSPPYDTGCSELGTRDCTYYKPYQWTSGQWMLTPIPGPSHFWCQELRVDLRELGQ